MILSQLYIQILGVHLIMHANSVLHNNNWGIINEKLKQVTRNMTSPR